MIRAPSLGSAEGGSPGFVPISKCFYHQGLSLSLTVKMEAVSFHFTYRVVTPWLAFFHYWHRIAFFFVNSQEVCILAQTQVFTFNFWHRIMSCLSNLPMELYISIVGIELCHSLPIRRRNLWLSIFGIELRHSMLSFHSILCTPRGQRWLYSLHCLAFASNLVWEFFSRNSGVWCLFALAFYLLCLASLHFMSWVLSPIPSTLLATYAPPNVSCTCLRSYWTLVDNSALMLSLLFVIHVFLLVIWLVLSLFSGNAEGSRNLWVIKFHGRLGCWLIPL